MVTAKMEQSMSSILLKNDLLKKNVKHAKLCIINFRKIVKLNSNKNIFH